MTNRYYSQFTERRIVNVTSPKPGPGARVLVDPKKLPPMPGPTKRRTKDNG